MKSVRIRKIIVNTHRYLGLLVGLILIIVGLTGSLLVFRHEIEDWSIQQQFGRVIAIEQKLSSATLVSNVTAAYANRPNWQIGMLQMLPESEIYRVRFNLPDNTEQEVFINPYTGKIMGDRSRATSLPGRMLHLHYELLSGNVGMIIVGIAALFLCILTVTGTILWTGWRKLWLGFKINWKAHPIRVNYDIHKVAGIVTAIFLGATAFTGFCWNFYDYTVPAIYAVTFTPQPVELKSVVVTGRSTLGLTDILARSNQALPAGMNTAIHFPQKPDDVFKVFKRLAQDLDNYSSYVILDRYSGKVLQVEDSHTIKLGDRILNAFTPLHYGTFGGLPTRILYVFVGLSPLVLFVTGAKMSKMRTIDKARKEAAQKLHATSLVSRGSANDN